MHVRVCPLGKYTLLANLYLTHHGQMRMEAR